MRKEFYKKRKKTEDLYKKVLAKAKSGVFLYGAGFIGRWSVGYLEQLNVPVLGFIDSDPSKWGAMICGKRIHSPLDPNVIKTKAVFITSRHAVSHIKQALSHLASEIMSIDAFVVHQVGKELIAKAENVFKWEKRSLETFYSVLCAMLDGNTKPLESVADNRRFFDRFGFFNRDKEIFVDAGAYVGDSLEQFIWSVNGVFQNIYAFEPGGLQFIALKQRVKRLISEWALKPDRIDLENKSLNCTNSICKILCTDVLIQTQIDSYNDTKDTNKNLPSIQSVSLDNYFKTKAFSFLKVDVEGSEHALIEGAKNSIRKHRPRIALSVYHYPTDIFTLPLKCIELNADYTCALGHHSSQLMDTVAYLRDKND